MYVIIFCVLAATIYALTHFPLWITVPLLAVGLMKIFVRE